MYDLLKFSNAAAEGLGYYVYCLVDPRNKEIFYIGKGKGNRVFDHEKQAENSAKVARIREIEKVGQQVEKYIIRHSLETEQVAFTVEAALIDLLAANIWSSRALLNEVKGHHSFEYGMKSVAEVENFFSDEKLNIDDIKEKVLIININKKYQYSCENNVIYEATRSAWRLSEKNTKVVELVFSEYKGIIRAVFKPEKWIFNKVRNRWEFLGKDVSSEYPQYMHKQNCLKKKGQQNPIMYVNL